jgi:dCMP deaminase
VTENGKLTKWDTRFVQLARFIAAWSRDPSTQTGAVIAGPDHRILSVGFNGFPAGMPDDASLYDDRDEKYSRILHCEVNALIFARIVPPKSTLYTYPFMSCDRCVVQMLQAGIRRFVAPKATESQLRRWGPAFTKTEKYIAECGGTLILQEP